MLVSANNPGVWQLAAQVEGARPMVRTIFRYKGSIAATPSATLQPPELTRQVLQYNMLKASGVFRLPDDTPDVSLPIQLSGEMGQYVWKMNNQTYPKAAPISVGKNRLVSFQFENQSMMPHPMHLHGHFFQVENGTGRGPLKDTVLADSMQKLTVKWISDNPRAWAFHCHNRYHEQVGMMLIVKVG